MDKAVVFSERERTSLVKLIDQRIGYLQDNAHRHRVSGDPFGELDQHERDIDEWQAVRAKLVDADAPEIDPRGGNYLDNRDRIARLESDFNDLEARIIRLEGES